MCFISTVVTGVWSDCSKQRLEYECNLYEKRTNISSSSCCLCTFLLVILQSQTVDVAEQCGGKLCSLSTAVYRLFSLCCVCLYEYGGEKDIKKN